MMLKTNQKRDAMTIKWLTSEQAAEYMGYRECTLRKARINGKSGPGAIAGVKPPRHYKVGGTIRYKESDLDFWIDGGRHEEAPAVISAPPLVRPARQKKPDAFKQFFALYPLRLKGGTDASAWKAWKSEKLSPEDAVLALEWLRAAAQADSNWGTHGKNEFIVGVTRFIRDRMWLTPLPFKQGDIDHGDSFGRTDAGNSKQAETMGEINVPEGM